MCFYDVLMLTNTFDLSNYNILISSFYSLFGLISIFVYLLYFFFMFLFILIKKMDHLMKIWKNIIILIKDKENGLTIIGVSKIKRKLIASII